MPAIDAPTAAIISASITAIVALFSIVINNYIQYLNTKANIRSRRTEITLGKRLDAFAKTGASMSRVNASIKQLRMAKLIQRPDSEIEERLNELYEDINVMIEVYHENISYFTKRVNDIFGDFSEVFIGHNVLFELLKKSDDTLEHLEAASKTSIDMLMKEIQGYIDDKQTKRRRWYLLWLA